MSGQVFKNQIDMRIPATEPSHLISRQEMIDFMASVQKDDAQAVSLDNLATGAGTDTTKLILTTPLTSLNGRTLAVDDRIIVKGQTLKTQNGIYEYEDSTTLNRAEDFDEDSELVPGTVIKVVAGDLTGATFKLVLGGAKPYILGSTAIDFDQVITDVAKVTEYTEIIEGDDTTLNFPVTHGLNTAAVTVDVVDLTTGEDIGVQVKRNGVNEVRIIFGEPPVTGEDHLVIVRAYVQP